MDLVIMFILGMIACASVLVAVACIVIGASGEDTKPKTKDEWRGLD